MWCLDLLMNDSFKITNVFRRPVSDEELVTDLANVHNKLGGNSVTFRQYNEHGLYSSQTITTRFGGWNEALSRAGITKKQIKNYDDKTLFENIAETWTELGRQPRIRDLSRAPSKISAGPYQRRFRSWIECLTAFEYWAMEMPTPAEPVRPDAKRTASTRTVSTRLRFQILKRDNFCCVACGRSPANQMGIILHVDHVVPWSRGGETIEPNLRTLCSVCNLGRSNQL